MAEAPPVYWNTVTNNLYTYEAQWTSNWMNSKTPTNRYTAVKVKNVKDRRKPRKKQEENDIHSRESQQIKSWLLRRNNGGQRQPNNIFKVLKEEKTCQERILYPAKVYFKNKGKIKNFPKAKTEIIYC